MSHCARCARISEMNLEYIRRRQKSKTVYAGGRHVRSWCRRCGVQVQIDFADLLYETAIERLQRVDQSPMEHEGGYHTEIAGWGIMWRFDDMLKAAFPTEYANDRNTPYWPMTAGYPFNREAESKPVEVIYAEKETPDEESYRRRLSREMNEEPRDRYELEVEYGKVWNPAELLEEFKLVAAREPFAIVERLAGGEIGTVMYQCNPRFYFDYRKDRTI